ncbi:2-hydroxychromene-2-carboxylate isomerase [Varunaivibrio sulfuroxidans]|uniref:2-hydroxychromene-2-carboxylate isomerase n=1 Tax=Varunaivibrio sulfuroxidans TaxID=1773489 RepID=A0A4R3JAF8_9PROT|nr:2-hydroxychromene-2-carboxylate isomerase [Varunaivibrio sulfuroxidans]TCS62537.1 2-hydroxychromene-2-carboxylate isomerase [Varunaivibrio sulfuroxidans]WES30793.1 2-hydroxychromene-2-carboxylate isomerase [Varunaivibrio sulfuroxidans]
MDARITYYFSLISPWTYLGDGRLRDIAAKHGAAIAYRPMQLRKVFPVSGGLPLPKRAPQRQEYRLIELKRWSGFLDIPLNLKPKFFPADETKAACMVTALNVQGEDPGAFVGAVLGAVWTREMDIADTHTLRQLAGEVGLDGDALLARAEDPAVRDAYQGYTDEAIAAGVFGAPFYVLEDEKFWGQDRLDFLERALTR